MTLTPVEFRSRFQTVTSAEEMTDLLLEGFQVFGHEGVEQMIMTIKEDQTGMPFSRSKADPKTGLFALTQKLNELTDHYSRNSQKPKRRLMPIVDEWDKLKNPEK